MATHENPPQRKSRLMRHFRPSKILVTDERLEELLSAPQPQFPAPDSYLPFNECGEHGGHGIGHNAGDGDDDPFFRSNGHHVGRDLTGKEGPVHPLDSMGPNPFGDRRFFADEFQGMLTFDRSGKPTFHSRVPEAKSIHDITELRLSIATRLPDFLTGDTPQAIEIEAMENDAFDGLPLADVFERVDDKMISQVKKYAREFEEAFGIRITVGFDLEDAHLSLLGYNQGDPELLGFASFPESLNDWPELDGLGAQPGYMVLNNQYTATASAKEVYDLFSHEFGHTLGLAHPHDLAMLNMGKREALTATKMAYTDLKLRSFRHVIADADGKPALSPTGRLRYYSEGPDEGVLDYGFRKWVANPPVMGHVGNPDPKDPQNDLYKGVYDLAAHMEFALKDNAESLVFNRERLLPMVPIINDGKHTVMKGSQGDDYLDTNPGYASTIRAVGARKSMRFIEQRFVLVEGHMEKVMGITGNNIIVAAASGEQEIHPGDGKNQLRFLYPDMTGRKSIISEGEDTLVLTEDLLEQQAFAARNTAAGITLDSGAAEIVLGGKGISRIRIVNDLGRTLVEKDVKGLSAEALNTTLFEHNAWKGLVTKPAGKPDGLKQPPPVNRADLSPIAAPTPLHSRKESLPATSGWRERIESESTRKSAVASRARG